MKDVNEIRENIIRTIRNMIPDHELPYITRKRLREEYNIADSFWLRGFGRYGDLKKALGIAHTRGDNRFTLAVGKASEVEHIRRETNQRLNWGDRFRKPDNGERFKTILIASDFHDRMCDPFAMRMFLQAASEIQPDQIVINGDLFDFMEFGKYCVDPREWDVVGRMKDGLKILESIRNVCPNSDIDLIEGNHEARVLKFLSEMSPQIMDIMLEIHDFNLEKFLGLTKYQVNYIAKLDLHSFTSYQLTREIKRTEKIYFDTILVRHHPPNKGNIHMPGTNGHHHRHQVSSHWNHKYGSFEWHQTGGMHRRCASYTEVDMEWNVGFLYGIVDRKYHRVIWNYVHVGDTGCQLGGVFYERNPDEYYGGLDDELKWFRR